jgi:hypothetical protein
MSATICGRCSKNSTMAFGPGAVTINNPCHGAVAEPAHLWVRDTASMPHRSV